MNLDELGRRIKTRREEHGLKQADLACALQVSPQAISKWERGENAPDIATLVPLSRLLGVSVDWLLGVYTESSDTFEATVLASGVQNTREMAKSMRPREFAAWINSICYLITEAVLRHDGVPVKYIGPGIVSFFSGTHHQDRAVVAALSARKTSSTALKIGICSGPICFGPVGHPDYAHPDITGEAFMIAFLSRDWAASNTSSGIVACTTTTGDLKSHPDVGPPRAADFAGFSQPIMLSEITD